MVMLQGGRSNTGAWVILACAAIVPGYAALFATNPIAQSHFAMRDQELICVTLAGVLGLLYWFWVLGKGPVARSGWKLEWMVLLAPGYAFFQIVPLPLGLVRVLSP